MARLTGLCSTGGCAAKYDAPLLEALLSTLPPSASPDLLVGLDPPDDAAVMRLDDGSALVFTLDFFPPIVDDPTEYGQIAANNALNDVYAMGGRPALALAIAAFPHDLDAGDAASILSGAARQCGEAGAVLAGGHTIRDVEPKFGLAVAGFVPADRVWRKAGAKPSDIVILTKPIGSGLLATGHRRNVVSEEHFSEARRWMIASSRAAAEVLSRHAPHAVTDLTGFGLLGHASEIARLSGVRITIDMTRVPLLPGARDCARDGVRTSAHEPNRSLVSDVLTVAPTIDECALALALDPQTAGGLLIVVDAETAPKVLDDLTRANAFAVEIGCVEEGQGVRLVGQI